MAKGRIGVLDHDENWVLEPTFDGMLTTVKGPVPIKRGKAWGLLDREGNVSVEPAFSEIGAFTGPLAPARKKKTWGYIDASGAWAIEPAFEAARSFRDGRAGVQKGGKWGFIDTSGAFVIEPNHDGVTVFSDGRAGFNVGGTDLNGLLTIGGKWGVLDVDGAMIVKPTFDAFVGYSNGLCAVQKGGRTQVIDVRGKAVWKPKAGIFVGPFREDRAWAWDGTTADQLRRVVSDAFEWLGEPVFSDSGVFSEGLCAVNVGGERSEGELIGGLWGFVDRDGSIVIEPQFDMADGFSAGFAAVKKKGKWGLIGKSGTASIPLTYAEIAVLSPSLVLARA